MSVPGPTDRVTIIGKTGAGKTQFACAFLASRNWDEMPWIILDYKRDKLIKEIGAAMSRKMYRTMKVTDKIPDEPGIYHIHLLPGEDDEAAEELMLRIWEHGRCGFYIDEGYMLPQALPRWKAYTYLLTQGRSLEIPMIMLYQRVKWMNMFAKEEASFFAVFQLTGDGDVKAVGEYVKFPRNFAGQLITPNHGLPKYHCIWYDVGDGSSRVLRPAPGRKEIIRTFAERSGSGKKSGTFFL